MLSLLSLVLRKTRVFLTFKWFAVWRQWQNYHWCSTRISTSNRKLFQTTWFKSISTMGSINGNHNWFNWHDWRGMVESGTFWILFYLHVDLRTILTLNCCSLFQTAFHSKLEMSQLIFTENQSTGFYWTFELTLVVFARKAGLVDDNEAKQNLVRKKKS